MAQKTTKTDAAKLDAALIKTGRAKLSRGEKPTREEQAAIRRSADAARLANSIPLSAWAEWAGVPTETLRQHANTHGVPLARLVDLRKLARWLAAHLGDSGDPKVELSKIRVESARIELTKLRGHTVPVAEVTEFFRLVGERYRGLSRSMQRRFGPAAADLFNELLDDIEQEVNGRLEGNDGQ